jgi:cell division protein FtsW (lipid II flippase)
MINYLLLLLFLTLMICGFLLVMDSVLESLDKKNARVVDSAIGGFIMGSFFSLCFVVIDRL